MRHRVTLAEAIAQPPQEIEARPSGWLDPQARFYGLRSYNNHGRWAMAMGTSLDALMTQGWMRVVMYRTNFQTSVVTNNPHRQPTSQQLRALTDAGIEHGWASLTHDNDETEHVLWTNTALTESPAFVDRKRLADLIKPLGNNIPVDRAVAFLQGKGYRTITKAHLSNLPNWRISGGFLRPERPYFDDDMERAPTS